MQGNNHSFASVVRLGMAGSLLYKGRLAFHPLDLVVTHQ